MMLWVFRAGGFLAAAAIALAAFAVSAAALPVLGIGTIAGGTVSWELQVIKDKNLDAANGFTLETLEFAGNPATQVALRGGEVDAIVTDVLWAARQEASGFDVTLVPYSTAVGGLMVLGNSPATTLADLKGQKIAVAGGPIDKSWLILRGLGLKQGINLADETEQVFAAPPLVMQAALSGEVQGAVNFWHFMAKMKANGMRELVSTEDAAIQLGLDPSTPLLAYAVSEKAVADRPGMVLALARASRAAKELMASDDALWDALRPMMNANSDKEFIALRDGWRAGIPPAGPVDPAAAQKLFATLAALGGDELTGGLTALPEGLFMTDE